jgi:hypothetical protein
VDHNFSVRSFCDGEDCVRNLEDAREESRREVGETIHEIHDKFDYSELCSNCYKINRVRCIHQ